jgi:hypothetical protein
VKHWLHAFALVAFLAAMCAYGGLIAAYVLAVSL